MSSDLSAVQTAHATTIVQVVVNEKLPVRAAHIALETARAESNLLNYANANNPASLALPHDAVGSDHGSVGLFQQQVGGAVNSTANWGTTAELMNPVTATQKFLAALVALKPTWEGSGTTNWGDAQRVQGSSSSDGAIYQHWDAWAIALGDALYSQLTKAPVPVPVQPPKQTTYVVVSGDTLFSIAARYLGNGNDWPQIYAANHSVIGSNPDLIKPGMRLVIP